MSQSKIVNLSFLGAALLATSAAHGLNPIGVEAISSQAANNTINGRVSPLEISWHRLSIRQFPSSRMTKSIADLTIADRFNDSRELAKDREPKTSRIRFVPLAFFMLFFVPLGIFYPLFLFYKMLLIKPDESKDIDGVNGILAEDREPSISTPKEPSTVAVAKKKDLSRATISKLQIAFDSSSNQLRQELSTVGDRPDLNTPSDLVSLMRQTATVLIEQKHWTHVSCDSTTRNTAEIRTEFYDISQQERNKIAHQHHNLANSSRQVTDASDEKYRYVVVTLILCTSHATPLFETINTKKQLLEELIRLCEMENDTVIKFELLWNPQQQDEYLSNDRLLIEYGDMTRLL